MNEKKNINLVIETYADLVLRLCSVYLKTKADQEEAFQDVFIKYHRSNKIFESDKHEKAWVIRATISVCKDYLRKNFWKNKLSFEEMKTEPTTYNTEQNQLLEVIQSLPSKYKSVIYMHYYEGYSGVEMANILQVKENTVYSLLSRARNLLKEKLGGEDFE